MIQIDTAYINDENKARYLEFDRTIFDTIGETYRCFNYLDGIIESFGEKFMRRGYLYEDFFRDTVIMLQQKICVNIWKLILDNEIDSLSIYRMRGFIRTDFNYIVHLKSIDISPYLESIIRETRNHFLSHNLHSDNDYRLELIKIRPLLDQIFAYFFNLRIKNFDNCIDVVPLDYFKGLELHYKNSVKDAFKGIII